MAYGKLRAALVCAGVSLMMTTCVNAASENPGVVEEEQSTVFDNGELPDSPAGPAEDDTGKEEQQGDETEITDPEEDSDTEGDVTGQPEEEPPKTEDGEDNTEQAGAGSWMQDAAGGWTYEENGIPLTGLQTLNGKTYYFDVAGVLQTGFQIVNGTDRYYFNPNGETPALGLGTQMQSVWIEDSSTAYYLGEDGKPQTGLQEIGTGNYFFDAEGKMLTGWQTDGNYTYYFKQTGTLGGTRGVMLRGWNNIGGKTYYFQKNGTLGKGKGSRYVGIIKIEGVRYYFNDTDDLGVLQTGWQKIGENLSYFKMTGDRGVKGMMFTGFKTIGDKIFYFQSGGATKNIGKLYTGWKTINGKTYYFKQSGENGVIGQMFTGWKTIGGKIFYFKQTGAYGVRGARQTSWLTTGGKRFFFKRSGGYGETGSLQLGWQKIDGKTYYFKQTGAYGTKGFMFKGWNNVGDDRFWFADNGAVKTGWQRYNSQWYYLKPKEKGAMATGWTYVPPSGSVYRDTSISSYKFYFRPNASGGPKGSLVQDVSDMIGHRWAADFYRVEVDRTRCVVTVYAKDQNGQYRIPVKAMTCSVGLPGPDTQTPRSTYAKPFKTIERMRWSEMMGHTYGQYCTRIVAGILFHSVAGSNTTSYNLSAFEYNRLGSPASHGCVRLNVRDAKWIHDRIASPGTQVVIRDNMYQPFDKPATIKIPAGQNWDPTDPNI